MLVEVCLRSTGGVCVAMGREPTGIGTSITSLQQFQDPADRQWPTGYGWPHFCTNLQKQVSAEAGQCAHRSAAYRALVETWYYLVSGARHKR